MSGKKFHHFTKIAFIGWIISATISISLTGFSIWVIIKLLIHFGVI